MEFTLVDKSKIAKALSEIFIAVGCEKETLDSLSTEKATKFYAELLSGYQYNPLDYLQNSSLIKIAKPHNKPADDILLPKIPFTSLCEHHFTPFCGFAHIAYSPQSYIAGLNKIISVVKTLSARLQLQEKLTEQIAQFLFNGIKAFGVFVLLDAQHSCTSSTTKGYTRLIACATRGTYSDSSVKSYLLNLINFQNSPKEKTIG